MSEEAEMATVQGEEADQKQNSNHIYGYVRVSTREQNEDPQLSGHMYEKEIDKVQFSC